MNGCEYSVLSQLLEDFYKERDNVAGERRAILEDRIAKLEQLVQTGSCKDVILDIQEQDRQRIARDLHDTSLQNLAHLTHQIELSALYIDKDPVQAKLELAVVNKTLRETIEEIRNTIFDLRPMSFDDLGLKATFERFIDNLNKEGQYELDLDIDEVTAEQNRILVTLYRVVQECFHNVVKHAEATKIVFTCKVKDNRCHIMIKDNGKGFPENPEDGKKHFGISCMKERVALLNGTFDLKSEQGKGVTVTIDVPLK